MFSLIACIGKNREIGKKGQLIFHLKNDMKFFRETTTGHKVFMGSRTWDSLPGKLPHRVNIVISKGPIPEADQTVTDLQAFIDQNQDTDEEIFVIGGGMIYSQLLKHAKNLYLTEVDATDPEADTFFPDFDKTKYHKTLIEKGSENELEYSVNKYTLK